MVILPGATPVTIPAGVIVAMVLSLVLQVPPPVVSVKAGVVEPTQTAGAPPVMEAKAGSALTVTVALVAFVQLLPSAAVVYTIVTVPGFKPVINPEEASTVAVAGSLLPHIPPPVASDSEVVLFTHTFIVPVIGDIVGNGFTTIV